MKFIFWLLKRFKNLKSIHNFYLFQYLYLSGKESVPNPTMSAIFWYLNIIELFYFKNLNKCDVICRDGSSLKISSFSYRACPSLRSSPVRAQTSHLFKHKFKNNTTFAEKTKNISAFLYVKEIMNTINGVINVEVI